MYLVGHDLFFYDWHAILTDTKARVNIKTVFPDIAGESSHKGETIVKPSYLYNGNLTRFRLKSLQWRHDERDCVSNHQRFDCLLDRLFRRKSEKTSKVKIGLGNDFTPNKANQLIFEKSFGHLFSSCCEMKLFELDLQMYVFKKINQWPIYFVLNW